MRDDSGIGVHFFKRKIIDASLVTVGCRRRALVVNAPNTSVNMAVTEFPGAQYVERRERVSSVCLYAPVGSNVDTKY